MSSIVSLLEIQKGMIKTWSGLLANIPLSWQICDGTNGTPDLRSKFVRGAPTITEAGGTGGADTVTLDSTMIPSHSHGTTDPTHTHSLTLSIRITTETGGTQHQSQVNKTSGSNTASITINNAGGGGAHNNMPAYYEVIYIMRIDQ